MPLEWPNIVQIDLSALAHNLRAVRGLLRPEAKIMGIVKSDAYGHGLLPVSRELVKQGIDALGVAVLQEALELRASGIDCPIVVLLGIRTEEEAREVVEKDLVPVVFDQGQVEVIVRESARRKKRTRVQLKIDTGMGRLGVPWDEVGGFIREVLGREELYIDGLMSHLSSADEPDRGFTEKQIERFRRAVDEGRALGLELPLNTLCNSAGIMAYRDSHFDMVRPGIMLYGGLPSPDFVHPTELMAVMRYTSRVVQVRDFPGGTPLSYGRTYCTEGPLRAAVLSAGYGNGLPRSLSNRGRVLIGDKKCPILGRVCMNLTLADVTGVQEVRPGDEAVFLGSQGDASITGDDMAGWAKTISYEIFCSVGRKNMREYVQ